VEGHDVIGMIGCGLQPQVEQVAWPELEDPHRLVREQHPVRPGREGR